MRPPWFVRANASCRFCNAQRLPPRIARGLEQEGVQRGDLIALAIPNAEDLLLAFLAFLMAAAAPLDCSWPKRIDGSSVC